VSARKIRYVASYGNNGLFSTYQDGGILFHRAFDVAEFAFSTYPDPDQAEGQHRDLSSFPMHASLGGDYAGINDARITSDMNQASLVLDNAKPPSAVITISRPIFVNQPYWIMLFNRPNIIAFKGTIGNFKPNVTQSGPNGTHSSGGWIPRDRRKH